MIDVNRVLLGLAQKRPVFHSEADFQHAFAWEIHELWPDCKMRLEFKAPRLDKRAYIDIWASHQAGGLAIELKYKTRPLDVTVGSETFELLNHAAHPPSRYDFLKDVQRLEAAVTSSASFSGYAVMLTNDSAYWNPARAEGGIGAAFDISEGRVCTGVLRWDSGASEGTKHGREEPIVLRGRYRVAWQPYSRVAGDVRGEFRYLLLEVSRDQIGARND